MALFKLIVLLLIPIFSTADYPSCPNVINRALWGARPALSTNRLNDPTSIVIVHHSDTPTCTTRDACKARVQNIQEFHMSTRGWDDIGYNFLIGGEGTIYEGRGWGLAGAHAKGWNSLSVGICLLGNLQEKNPSAAQLMSLESLIACGVENNKVASDYHLIGHRQAGETVCPGDKMFRILKNMPNFDPNPQKN